MRLFPVRNAWESLRLCYLSSSIISKYMNCDARMAKGGKSSPHDNLTRPIWGALPVPLHHRTSFKQWSQDVLSQQFFSYSICLSFSSFLLEDAKNSPNGEGTSFPGRSLYP